MDAPLLRTDIHCRSAWLEPSIGVWENDTYSVGAFMDQGFIRLDIIRRDMKDGITWDELNWIKNQCGFAEFDACEFFPRQRDVINVANVRHLYITSTPFSVLKRNN